MKWDYLELNVCWKYEKRSILFKYKDDVIPWLISCIELDQAGMVQIIHDLDLILHHVLPKTQAQDRCGSGTERRRTRDTRTQTQRQRQASTNTRTRWEVSAVLCGERQCIFSSRSTISHLGEKYSLCFCSKCGLVVRTINCNWAPLLFISCSSRCAY